MIQKIKSRERWVLGIYRSEYRKIVKKHIFRTLNFHRDKTRTNYDATLMYSLQGERSTLAVSFR